LVREPCVAGTAISVDGFCRKLPGGASISHYTPTECFVGGGGGNLMLALNLPLLNREYTSINALKTLASIISMCNLHVNFFSKIAPRYFTLFTNGMFRSFSVRWDRKHNSSIVAPGFIAAETCFPRFA
jgi:hypothetical protein